MPDRSGPGFQEPLARLQILAESDRVALAGHLGNVGRHRLSAPAIVIGVDGDLRLRSERLHQGRAMLVRPGRWHSFDPTAGRMAVFLLPPSALRSDQLDWVQELSTPGWWLEIAQALLDRKLTTWEPIDRCLAQERVAARPIDDRLRSALSTLEGALDENLAIEELAAIAALSSSRLMTLVREQLGTSLRGYRRWLRTFRVVQDYAAGRSLTEAAFAAGFASSPHLSVAAREQFGIRPSDVLCPANRATIRVISGGSDGADRAVPSARGRRGDLTVPR